MRGIFSRQDSWQAHISNSGGIRVVLHYSDWDQNRSEKRRNRLQKNIYEVNAYSRTIYAIKILLPLICIYLFESRWDSNKALHIALLTFFWSALKTIRVELGNDPCNTARLRLCFEKEYGVRTHSEKNVQKDYLGSSPLHCQKDGTKTIICH